jgi:PAS domain S-box-containing protein
LHLEDDADYRTLVRDLLAGEGCTAEVVGVANRVDFESALAGEPFDVILGDFSLPDYDGLQALTAARERAPQTPFLLVSGTIGEQAAIESLRAGATDYVLKQWPDRLVPAVRRAVEEARERERRRQVEAELVRKEGYFRALTDNSQEVVSLVDGTGCFLYNSPALRRMLGYGPNALIARNVLDFINPEDRSRVRQAFRVGLVNSGQLVVLEFRFRHQNGSWVYLEASGQNRLNDPEVKAVVFNLRDVTERRRIEQCHQALYNLGRSLSSVRGPNEAAETIRAVADQLFAWDAFTLDLYYEATDQMRPILNVDTIGGQRAVVETPDGVHAASALARRIMQSGAERILVEQPVRMLPDARPFGDTDRASASLLFAPIRNRTKVVGLLSVQSYTPQAYTERDLETLQVLADHCGGALERIGAEEALRESEERFREIFANSPDAIFVEDLEGKVLDVNPAGCRLHGLTRDRLAGRNGSDLVPPEQRRDLERAFKQLTEGLVSRMEGESLAADGRITPVEIRATRIDYSGQPALLLHVRDVSERKQTESALRSSELLFRSVWENSVDGMRLTDEQGLIVAVNEAFCKLVGLSRADLEGNPFTVIYADPEQPERILKKYQQRFRDRVLDRQIERRLTLRNGNIVVLEDTSSFVELRGQPPLLLGLFRDVTVQKQLEDQLRQAQKMDAIGQLAGGVAHDFNNILTVIHGHASMLLGGGGLTGTAGKSARQIVYAAERAAGLTRQLLTFSRRQVMQPCRLDLNEVVATMTKMLDRILGEDIALQMSYWPAAPLISADASMMEQVLLNLAVNARDAMPQGGQLSIRISIEDVPARPASQSADARPGRFVCLTASDTGCGIPPEILRRIFEPFFTTKEVGKGTGLGLATVYGIVKQHQGWIEVESQLSRGTTFRVYLPEATEGAERSEETIPESSVRGGNETILVVEDEQPVRELVCSLMEELGYKILAAESGDRALDIWRQHKHEIALLLTDVVMPDRLNGRELAELLWREQPSLKVVFTSGYNEDVVGRDWLHRRGFNYVQKPYPPRKLAMAVRDCLDATDMTPAF